jgi:hypothetical protein
VVNAGGNRQIRGRDDDPDLVTFLRSHFVLDWHGIHGAKHWARVKLNGLLLAAETGPTRTSSSCSRSCTTAAARTTGTTPRTGRGPQRWQAGFATSS